MRSDYTASRISSDEWVCNKHNTWGKTGTRCVECENIELKQTVTNLTYLLGESENQRINNMTKQKNNIIGIVEAMKTEIRPASGGRFMDTNLYEHFTLDTVISKIKES